MLLEQEKQFLMKLYLVFGSSFTIDDIRDRSNLYNEYVENSRLMEKQILSKYGGKCANGSLLYYVYESYIISNNIKQYEFTQKFYDEVMNVK